MTTQEWQELSPMEQSDLVTLSKARREKVNELFFDTNLTDEEYIEETLPIYLEQAKADGIVTD